MQENVKKWFAECKEKYGIDTIEKALKEKRCAIRTFSKKAIFKNKGDSYNAHGGKGMLPLQHLTEQLNFSNINTKEKRKQGGYSAVPATMANANPFQANASKYGVLITLPYEEDMQKFKEYTNKNFITKHNIDSSLVKEIRAFLTRPSYYNPLKDIQTHYDADDNKISPLKTTIPTRTSFLEIKKSELKTMAQNYQGINRDPINILNFLEHNPQYIEEYKEAINKAQESEIVIKPRISSKYAIVCFDEKDLPELKKTNATSLFPEKCDAFYGVYKNGKLEALAQDASPLTGKQR